MLSIIEYGKGEYEFPALLVLGCFDAIHVGHRELLKKAKLQAKINGLDLGVMMFKDGKNGKLLYSFEERCEMLEKLNVKFVLAIDFNDDFKAITPVDFLHTVEDKINIKAYMSGKDFRFGAQAKGKSSTLKNYAEDEENGVWYMPVKDVELCGEKVSTTLIKACLTEGNIAKANKLLGSEFLMSGEVVKGAGRGTTVVGFPTVNIFYPKWKHDVKHGVYSVKCLIDDTDYTGIANYGTCPTFGDDRIALEVYFEGFSGDLYGRTLTIRFVDYIRDIEEFASAEELSEQLSTDLDTVNGELVVDEKQEQAVGEEQPAVEEQPVIEEQPVADVQPEEIVEIPVDTQPLEELAVEDEFAEAYESVSEEQVVEEQPAVEEQPVIEEQAVADVQTEEIIEIPVDTQPLEELAVEDEFAEAYESVSEEQVVEEQPVIEEQPVEMHSEELVDVAALEAVKEDEEQSDDKIDESVDGEAQIEDNGEQDVD